MRSMAAIHLHGLNLSDAKCRMGDLSQCARIDRFTHDDGPQRGSRLLRAITGGGLTFDVHPDRCMDLGQVEIHGVPVAWMSPTGIADPGLYHPQGDLFLRTFGGGFLTTCGLDHTGGPCEDEGKSFGQHGRVNGIPASVTRTSVDEEGLIIEGVVRQAAVHGENLELRRRLHANVGCTQFTLTDTVTNLGGADQPHMVMYHCNFGWPLLSEDTKVTVPHAKVEPHNPEAKDDPWNALHPPERGYAERVYLHTLKKGTVDVTLDNPRLDFTLTMSFDSATLPGLCQWKMLAEGQYVLGLEPRNDLCLHGRRQARKEGLLKFLKPKESVTYAITFRAERR